MTKAEKRDQRREQDRERLAQAVAELASEAGFRRWLEVRSAMHSYSMHNTLLIAMQAPEASQVAGYNKWLDLGRQVRKGEKSIRILAPRKAKVENEETGEKETRVIGFIGVGVFDVSQTDGEDLGEPPVPGPIDGDSHEGLLDGLYAKAKDLGYMVHHDKLGEGHGGYCDETNRVIVVNEEYSPNARVRVLAHEIAHALGVNYKTHERGDAETIVEAAAAIALKAAGLETDFASVPYIAGWAKGDAAKIDEAAALIDKLARELEGALGL